MMSDDDAVMHYLRSYAGVRMNYCKMLNFLAKVQTGHDKLRNPVSMAVRRAKWLNIQQATNRLVEAKMVIRHRGPRPKRRVTVRINEAFVKIPFYRTT